MWAARWARSPIRRSAPMPAQAFNQEFSLQPDARVTDMRREGDEAVIAHSRMPMASA